MDYLKEYPKNSHVYTLDQIENVLTLDDSPYLGFVHHGKQCVIQTSHVTSEQLLSVPGFSKTRWQYRYTTSEWIPVFAYVIIEDIEKFVDIVKDIEEPDAFWVTPKGFPRQQHTWRD